MSRRAIPDPIIDDIRETQEVLDVRVARRITPYVAVISIQDINHAYERIKSSSVDFHHVIDVTSLKRGQDAAAA